jgi:hypothetical protein
MSEVTVTITNTDVNLTETYTTLSLGNAGPQGIPGNTGPTGPKGDKGDTGDTGPAGILAQDEEPIDTDVLWLDTDEAAAQLAVADIPELPQSKTTNLVSDLGARVTSDAAQGWSNQSDNIVDPAGRLNITANVSTASGRVTWYIFTPLKTATVSQMTMLTGTTASSGLTLARMGLYTFDGTTFTLVARTASDTTLFNATTTLFTRSFDTTGGYPATYTLVPGQRYAFANIQTGTTVSNFVGGTHSATLMGLTPRITSFLNSQSDLPTTNTSLTAGGIFQWGRFS